ncbi:hypothetical protein [Deinococcus hohokamensis]|uniref:Phage tail assembly protein n=1 Tax=Deinococcus hohokamensis TaxID=309883 RepID=A0ABV9IDR6_9DEIO
MNSYPFMLPVGLLTSDGRIHRAGSMRPATALDEIEPLGDERVRRNEAYYGLLLLARVVTQLGPFAPVTPDVLAALPAADYAYLQALYASLNTQAGPVVSQMPQLPAPQMMAASAAPGPAPAGPATVETECPHCGALLELDLSDAGASA